MVEKMFVFYLEPIHFKGVVGEFNFKNIILSQNYNIAEEICSSAIFLFFKISDAATAFKFYHFNRKGHYYNFYYFSDFRTDRSFLLLSQLR